MTEAVAAPRPMSGVSPIFLGLLATFALCAAWLMSGQPVGVAVFLFVLVGWVISLCLHEWGHAFAAWKGGDSSVADKGYLTLNPLRYSDPVTSIIMPLVFLAFGGIGFPGGAVYVQTSALRGPLWRAGVSAAGPAMNLVFLLGIGLVLSSGVVGEQSALGGALAFLALLQGTAFVLNLLPIPGLDGFGILEGLLPARISARLAGLKAIAMIVFFIAIVLVPQAFQPVWEAALALCGAVGIDRFSVAEGHALFEFWTPPMDVVE